MARQLGVHHLTAPGVTARRIPVGDVYADEKIRASVHVAVNQRGLIQDVDAVVQGVDRLGMRVRPGPGIGTRGKTTHGAAVRLRRRHVAGFVGKAQSRQKFAGGVLVGGPRTGSHDGPWVQPPAMPTIRQAGNVGGSQHPGSVRTAWHGSQLDASVRASRPSSRRRRAAHMFPNRVRRGKPRAVSDVRGDEGGGRRAPPNPHVPTQILSYGRTSSALPTSHEGNDGRRVRLGCGPSAIVLVNVRTVPAFLSQIVSAPRAAPVRPCRPTSVLISVSNSVSRDFPGGGGWKDAETTRRNRRNVICSET